MAFADFKIKYVFSKFSPFTLEAVQFEISQMLLKNSAFQNEVKKISGKIPPGLLGGKFSHFVITDDEGVFITEAGTSRVERNKAGFGVPNAEKNNYVIYLNPRQTFHNDEGRTLTVAETLAHEFGHATDDGLKETEDQVARNDRGVHGPVAIKFEEDFDRAHIPPLKPVPNDAPPQDRQPGEPVAYLYANPQARSK